MFVPEYTITSKTLKNIGLLEYGKSVIDNTVILQSWEKQLETQAKVDHLTSCAQLLDIPYTEDIIKKICSNVAINPPTQLLNVQKAYEFVLTNKYSKETNEEELKKLFQILTATTKYRTKNIAGKTSPEEILAEVVEFFDWINSLDAKEAHPVILAALTKARLQQIAPFEKLNDLIADLMALEVLQKAGYTFKNATTVVHYYAKGKHEYTKQFAQLIISNNDLTQWIEYFSEGLAMQVNSTQDKIKLLAKDSKIAKATGRARLTPRQEKIVEYIQDFGLFQNKDFSLLFPDKSEDSILRDLKTLVALGIIQKVGSTKSSRYELK